MSRSAARGAHVRGLAEARSQRREAAARSGRRRSRLTVRARILAAVVALSALTVVTAGATAFLLQVRGTDAGTDNSLARAVAGLQLVKSRPDPGTGQPYQTVDRVLNEAVRSRVPGKDEGVVALLNGRPKWLPAPETRSLPLSEDDALMTELEGLSEDGPVVTRTVGTPVTQYRYVAVPVTLASDPGSTGLFVVAFDRSAQVRALRGTFVTYSAVGIGALVVIGAAAWLLVGRLLRPVRLLGDTARRITESDLSERIEVTGADDLSELGRTVNAMLDRLERAFSSQRELLDDVGHELRTPLTIVRGHLELVDPEDADDVRSTQALALDELDRMQRLVDDLMTLATADRPDFVRPAPVDVGRLTDDVHDKARGLGDRRWLVAARADVTAQVDEQRITQAWLQLLANAQRYSTPGSTVRLGSEVRDGRLLLWVRDEGSGVPPDEVDRIFDRFHRGRADRSAHGYGLGLPIVAAIARAHHGRVFLEQPPDGDQPGVVFVLDLPLVGAGTEADDDEATGAGTDADPSDLELAERR
jgi:signal transduction histidine kinase